MRAGVPPTLPSVHGLRAGDDIADVDELGLYVVHCWRGCGVVSRGEKKRAGLDERVFIGRDGYLYYRRT